MVQDSARLKIGAHLGPCQHPEWKIGVKRERAIDEMVASATWFFFFFLSGARAAEESPRARHPWSTRSSHPWGSFFLTSMVAEPITAEELAVRAHQSFVASDGGRSPNSVTEPAPHPRKQRSAHGGLRFISTEIFTRLS